jgi:threonine dehydrogenase-like Zn-dependent dehydrogenase
MTQIKVARFTGPSKESPLKLGTAEKPTPGPKDVLVKVHACNVVPNTANMLTNTESLPEGFNIAMDPIAFGLDASGTIEAVGEHVLNLKVGDRVYVDPYLTCDTCQPCRRGMYFVVRNGSVS